MCNSEKEEAIIEEYCMTKQEKIQVLMKEYETLRSEMIQRFNSRFQFIMIIGAISGYSFFEIENNSYHKILVLIIAMISVIAIWFWIGYLTAEQSWRISDIEKQVNELAGQKLLRWETYQIDNGIFHKIYRRKRNHQQER